MLSSRAYYNVYTKEKITKYTLERRKMASTAGLLFGEFLSGALAEAFPVRIVCSTFMAANLCAVFFIMYANAKEVKLIYNRKV